MARTTYRDKSAKELAALADVASTNAALARAQRRSSADPAQREAVTAQANRSGVQRRAEAELRHRS